MNLGLNLGWFRVVLCFVRVMSVGERLIIDLRSLSMDGDFFLFSILCSCSMKFVIVFLFGLSWIDFGVKFFIDIKIIG